MTAPRFGIYRRAKGTGLKPNPKSLERVFGDGPPALLFEKGRNGLPGSFCAPESKRQLYSFSSVCQVVKPVLDPGFETGIQAWKEKVGEIQAEEIRNEAINAGKQIHREVERRFQGRNLGPCSLGQVPYRQALEEYILPELEQVIPPHGIWTERGEYLPLSEISLVDFDRGYLGRLDLVAELKNPPYNGKRVLLELKASRNHKSLEFLADPIIQATSYLEILEKITRAFPENCPFSPLDGVAIAYAYGSGRGEIFPILGEDLFEYRDQWNLWLQTFHEILEDPIAS